MSVFIPRRPVPTSGGLRRLTTGPRPPAHAHVGSTPQLAGCRSCRRSTRGRFGDGATLAPSDESARGELVEPSSHRPPTPALVKDGGVGNDVPKMLDWGIGYWMVLMECVRTADPAHPDVF